MMIYSNISPAVMKTWAQLRGLAWGRNITDPVSMDYLKSLTGKTQSALYEHMRVLRDTHALRWQMADASTFIFSFPSNEEFNSYFLEDAPSLNNELNTEEDKEIKPVFIPEKANKGRQRATKATVPAEILSPIVDALADVTGMNKSLNYGRMAKEGKDLHLAGFTCEHIRIVYSPGGSWWTKDWRGKKGEKPALGNIRQTIGELLNGNGNKPHPDYVGSFTRAEMDVIMERDPNAPRKEIPF